MEENNIFYPIKIDSREPTDKITEILFEISNYALFPNFKIEALEYGDYELNNNNIKVLIERKEYHDYINSINDTLKKRLIKMRQEADYTILIIEGAPPMVDHHIYYNNGCILSQGCKTNVYSNFIFSQQLEGTFILPTINLKHTMLTILSIYDYIGRLDKRVVPKAINPIEALMMLPGVGRKRSTIIKNKYINMIEALKNCEEWLKEDVLKNFRREW